MPSINSLWISGVGKLEDVRTPPAISHAKHLVGVHPLLVGLAKLLGIPHLASLDPSLEAGSFAWLDQPQLIWPQLSKALEEKRLDEILLIDFPDGKTRERIFTTKDLRKKSWAFWKKTEAVTWKEITEA
jgi:hypothetical protein